MGKLYVERKGGLAGIGGTGSVIRSRGEIALATLSKNDLATLQALFQSATPSAQPSSVRDGYCYRISRGTGAEVQTIEVPEHVVPLAIAQCVKDDWA